MENYHLSIHMAFWKESMINRLSNLINRNRSAAKILQVLCSTDYISFSSASNESIRIQKTQNSAICLFFLSNTLTFVRALPENWDIYGKCSLGPACRDVTKPVDRRVLQKLFQTFHSLPNCGEISCIVMLSMKGLS